MSEGIFLDEKLNNGKFHFIGIDRKTNKKVFCRSLNNGYVEFAVDWAKKQAGEKK